MSSVIETIHILLERPVTTEVTILTIDDSSIDRLLRLLCDTRDDELSCEEVYACLDEYVDCLLSHNQAMSNRALVEHHLSLCADCELELRALQHALAQLAADD